MPSKYSLEFQVREETVGQWQVWFNFDGDFTGFIIGLGHSRAAALDEALENLQDAIGLVNAERSATTK